MAAEVVVERQHADDAAATDDMMINNLPLLVFQRRKEDDMFMLSVVSDQTILLHKNTDDHYDILRQRKNLYWSTPQGWMLVLEYPPPQQGEEPDTSSAAAYLWNPRTGDKLPLPNIQEHRHALSASRCRLTHKDPAADPGCVVVLLLLKDGGVPHMCFCHTTGASRRWRCFPYQLPDLDGLADFLGFELRSFISVVTACRGKLYFINTRESIGVIDFSRSSSADGDDHHPVFQYFDVPRINHPHGTSSGRQRLVESHGDLFLIYMSFVYDSDSRANNLSAVNAYEMDFSARCWRMVSDIGDAVIFLDTGYSNIAASYAASRLGLKPNRIYFVNTSSSKDDDGWLCTFDLGLNIMENVWVHPAARSSNLFRYFIPFWIVPPSST